MVLLISVSIMAADPPYVRVEWPLDLALELSRSYKFSAVEVDETGSLIVAGDESLLALFDDLGVPYSVDMDRYWRERAERERMKAVPSSYFDPSTLTSWLQNLVASHPTITELIQIGTSVQGRAIWAVKVTDNPGLEENEPELRLIGNIHGDEKSSLMVCTDALEWIVTQYGMAPEATTLVEQTEMWFVPMVNPDGNNSSTRRNAHNYDLNRNFRGPEGHDPFSGGPSPFSEPETQAIRDLTEVMGNRFALGLSFHSGAACFNSVWNYSVTAPADLANFFSSRTGGTPCGNFGGDCAIPSANGLAEAYGQGCSYPGFWHVVGADWYVTYGDTNDWAYDEWGTLDTTLECTDSKTPSAAQIPTYTVQHRMGVINYLLKARQVIEGIVTDAGTGNPLDAEIVVTQFPQVIYTDPLLGDYHRFVVPGTYSITASAVGYLSETVTDVVVVADSPTVVDFQLLPDSITFESLRSYWPNSGPIDINANNRIDVIELVQFL